MSPDNRSGSRWEVYAVAVVRGRIASVGTGGGGSGGLVIGPVARRSVTSEFRMRYTSV